MTGPRDRFKEPSPTLKTKSKFEEDLDSSRKTKLWERSNYLGSFVIVFIIGIAYLSMCADVRGEYSGSSDGLGGMIMCSIAHADQQVNFSLIIPNTPMMVSKTADENIGQEVTLVFKPLREHTGARNITFKGRFDSNGVNGLLQNGTQLNPVSFHKDPIASILQQLRSLIPGSNTPIDLDAPSSLLK